MTTLLPSSNQTSTTVKTLPLTEAPANVARIEAVAVKAKAAAIAEAVAPVTPTMILPVMIAKEAIEAVVRRIDLLETSRKRKLLSIWPRKLKEGFFLSFL